MAAFVILTVFLYQKGSAESKNPGGTERVDPGAGGAVAAAFGAGLCCIGPVLFALFGLGAFGAASVFESLRPYLLARHSRHAHAKRIGGLPALVDGVCRFDTSRKTQTE